MHLTTEPTRVTEEAPSEDAPDPEMDVLQATATAMHQEPSSPAAPGNTTGQVLPELQEIVTDTTAPAQMESANGTKLGDLAVRGEADAVVLHDDHDGDGSDGLASPILQHPAPTTSMHTEAVAEASSLSTPPQPESNTSPGDSAAIDACAALGNAAHGAPALVPSATATLDTRINS